ncbi:hypothetical protein TELCIR_13855 [Teladorsagia circumcincta]|uniref:Uncharacterized protein n=1 Tax=Teladorsagia circumcincta TaxID=45464 RepID=A0A2G9U2V7_TELCI|nr:hypothetical protein TELCIR_13855 [Teladorsagia circumcincta]
MVKQQSHEKLDEVKGIKKYEKDDKKNEAQMHHKEGDEGRKEAEGEKELEVKRTMSEPNIPGSEKPTEEDSETEEKKKSDDLGSKEKKS